MAGWKMILKNGPVIQTHSKGHATIAIRNTSTPPVCLHHPLFPLSFLPAQGWDI